MVGLVDYGMGNLRSVANACEHLGYSIKLVQQGSDLTEVTRIILPGVGSFMRGMENLRKNNLVNSLKEKVRTGTPLLGICLGMQLLADIGAEGGEVAGLGLISGSVVRMDDSQVRLPHVGWNNIEVNWDAPLTASDSVYGAADGVFAGIDGADFYFVHSYKFVAQVADQVLAVSHYPSEFPAIVGKGNVMGVQFHPEKSHHAGLLLLSSFLGLKC